jgi:hypothetical protein
LLASGIVSDRRRGRIVPEHEEGTVVADRVVDGECVVSVIGGGRKEKRTAGERRIAIESRAGDTERALENDDGAASSIQKRSTKRVAAEERAGGNRHRSAAEVTSSGRGIGIGGVWREAAIE